MGLKRRVAFFLATLFRSRSFSYFGLARGLVSHQGEIHVLYPASLKKTSPPKTIHSKIHWQFEAWKEIPHREGAIFTLKEAFATASGAHLQKEGKLVTTYCQLTDIKDLKKSSLFEASFSRFFPTTGRFEKKVASLAGGWEGAFYHWFYETLPRLHLVEPFSDQFYIAHATPFQKESLAMLGITPDRIIESGSLQALQASELIVSSMPTVGSPWAIQFLKEKFLPQLTKGKLRRLYISRSDAAKRRILNEEALMELLSQYGFEKVVLTPLSLKEQMELFYSAEMIVAPHGAALSHLVFCEENTPLLEIYSPAYVNICYWKIADALGLQYHYLLGEGEEYPDFFDPHLDPDIVVDLKKVEASLTSMLQSKVIA